MPEGRLVATNRLGRAVVSADQEVVVRGNQAPVVAIALRPRDAAVQWAIYHPPVLVEFATGAGPVAASDLPTPVQQAIKLHRQGRIGAAVEVLDRAARCR